ncbi:class E sortase [Streptomyces sp. NPDC057939]|uniref:class E sortase n=1 Tax=Streptomyces sp. NPDC057939 TaxID=3346284 RepID=UPI0036E443F9
MRSRWNPPRPDVVLRLVVRTFSEVCLTVGTIIVLFVAYVLMWTGVKADRAMDGERDRLRAGWAAGAPPAASAAPERTGEPPAAPAVPGAPGAAQEDDRPAPYPPGRAFAEMTIPRFGAGWTKPVLEGTDPELLKKGLGHYAGSARPGGTGNFAVAGHRRTYGDPFKDIPMLRPGDTVEVRDATHRYTYTVRAPALRVLPTETGVVDAVPEKSPFTAPGKYLTLTTCEPEWGHSHRLVIWAELTGTRSAEPARAEGSPR